MPKLITQPDGTVLWDYDVPAAPAPEVKVAKSPKPASKSSKETS